MYVSPHTISIGNVLTWAPEGFPALSAMPHSFVTSYRHFPVDPGKFSAVEGWGGWHFSRAEGLPEQTEAEQIRLDLTWDPT